ncbi:phage major capsid protein [Pontibacillus salipaludis]|uniref:Major capsid protein n=1 Tax=Pontibacillus salipaludis TaxID=1697394 RepID=A0ABQ1PW60_9BACI|nr:phage major capsid protein [Pontibacillus salipaludis]GGD05381.1 major capsid protein [Pontibacillus salipaludis]
MTYKKLKPLKLNIQHFAPKMQNLDKEQEKQNELKQKISDAVNSGDQDAVNAALLAMAENVQQNVLQEAQSYINQDMTDAKIMEQRGVHALTNEEKKYYNEVIDGQGFSGVETLVPATVIDRVFEDLKQNHPLLNSIDFVNTTGITEWVMRKGDVNPAFWGKLTSAIRELLDEGFEKTKMDLYKLSAFIPVAKAMLDLGPQWLDRYVRTVLAEAMSIALEEAIVKGTGKEQPIGMIKDLNGAVTDGVYPNKTATTLSDLTAKALGQKVMAPLTKNGKRAVGNVIMVVNPLDYWNKIFGEQVILNQNGTYVNTGLPIPGTIIQSVAMPQGKMSVGLAKDYFMGAGSSRQVETSSEYRFLEDEKVYMTKMYANGRPKDNDSFLLFDISGIGAATP